MWASPRRVQYVPQLVHGQFVIDAHFRDKGLAGSFAGCKLAALVRHSTDNCRGRVFAAVPFYLLAAPYSAAVEAVTARGVEGVQLHGLPSRPTPASPNLRILNPIPPRVLRRIQRRISTAQ